MKYFIFFFFFVVSQVVVSQKIKILDKETGKIVKNSTVFNNSHTINLSSDKNGFVDISDFKTDEVIVISHISYALLKIKKSVLERQNLTAYLTKQSEQLNEVVLSVFKKAEKTNRIAEQIAIVSAKDIQKISPQTSADLLATIQGIKVQKSQFGGGSPVIRGLESNRVLLVVDGVRMNNAIYRKGHLQNSISVAPNLLEKTEVVFGPSSVIYGSDALGGVIHYYTKRPRISENHKITSHFFSRYSSVNKEFTNNFSAEVSFKNWASFTSVSYSEFADLKAGKNRSHGFDNFGKVFYYSENTNGNFKENPTKNTDVNLLRNTGYNQTDVLQKFNLALSKNTDLNFNLQYSTSSDIPRFDRLTELNDLRNPSSLKFAEWFYGPQNRLLLSSQLEINPNKNWLDNGTITAAYQNIKESRIQRKFKSLNRSYREEIVDIYSLNGDFSVPLTENKKRILSYGFELAHNIVSSNSFGRTLNISNGNLDGFSGDFPVQSRYPDGGSSYTSSAAYLGYRQDLNAKSTLNSGIRFTNTHLEATWVSQRFIQLEEPNIKTNNSAVTATLGYVYRPSNNWQLSSVLSSGFRSPNIDDVGRVREKAGNVTVPNIHVAPEFAYNAEVGIQKYFNDRKFKVGGNFYYTLLDNYIQRDFVLNSDGTNKQVEFDGELGNAVSNQNKGTAYILGYTLNYLGKLTNKWNTTGFITYTKGRTNDTDEPLSSIPPLFGQFDVNYTKKDMELGVTIRFNSKKDIEDFNITEGIDNHDLTPIVNLDSKNPLDRYFGSPGWIALGINGNYKVNKNVAIQARLDNILDEHYIEFASGVSAPGRNLSIAFMIDF